MIVYALVGKSGTGKSFQAVNLCEEKGIEAIIDDGLFIFSGKILAGKSAKKEPTKVAAVKTALFYKDEHKRSVVRKIKQQNLKRILIIGTSIGMVEKIVERLEFPKISKFIFIEDITTEKERKIAKKQRGVHGKHVVPAPSVELKKQFSGYFTNSFKMLKTFSGKGNKIFLEKTEVRPTFSYVGEVVISEKVIKDIVKCLVTEVEGVLSIIKVNIETGIKGMTITILLSMSGNGNIIKNVKAIQQKSFDVIEHMTSYNIVAVNIEVRNVEL